ncbi:hypothetical protein VTK26DRAFT_4701 [Humicola hyalothermophila]
MALYRPFPSTMKLLKQLVGTAVNLCVLRVGATPSGLSVGPRQATADCSEGAVIEDLWLVKNLNVNFTDDERVRQANATFTITSSLTDTTETIHCPLRANYICEVYGTPAQDNLQIWLQINLGIAKFTLNQTVDCSGEGGPQIAYAFGTAELYLICPDIYRDDMSCHSEEDFGATADGSISLQANPSVVPVKGNS